MAKPRSEQPITKKVRKVVDGHIKSAEKTKKKILLSVGKLFSKEGYTGLNVTRIAGEADINPRMVYHYFGSLDNLLRIYFGEKDFWDPFYNKLIADLLTNNKPLNADDIFAILHGQFDAILYNKEFQRAIHWEISEKSDVMRKISDEREHVGKRLFEQTEDRFKNTDIDLPASLALQIAGIYYLGLHAKINGSTFCGIDINTGEGRSRVENALKKIIEDLYKGKSI